MARTAPHRQRAAPSAARRGMAALPVLAIASGTLCATVALAPATWAAGALARATGARLQLHLPTGTVWNGSATLALHADAGSRDAVALPGRLRWQLQPTRQGLQLRLVADCCTSEPIELHLGWAGGTLRLRVADTSKPSRWPAALLAGLGAPWNTLQPEGWLVVRSQGLQLRWTPGAAALDGRLDIEAQAMATRLSPVRPLGSYRLLLAGGTAPTLELTTLAGPLELQGTGTWSGQRLRFSGTARAQTGREAALANLLNLLGRRDGARSILSFG